MYALRRPPARLVISLDEIYLHWSEFRKPDLRVIGTDNRSDGSVNMEKVAAYIAENNLSWDDFPAFKWCREKGEAGTFRRSRTAEHRP